jgi:hypothetical protein
MTPHGNFRRGVPPWAPMLSRKRNGKGAPTEGRPYRNNPRSN